MQLITRDILHSAKNGAAFRGVIFCSWYSVAHTKTNKEYIMGDLMAGDIIQFKAWDSSLAFKSLRGSDLSGKPLSVSGTFSEYNGVMGVVLDSVAEVQGYSEEQFLPVKYDVGAYWAGLISYIDNNVSEGCSGLAHKILFDNVEYADRFKLEFAASHHHDNCMSGLLAHTYKVVITVGWILNIYGGLLNVPDKGKFKDTVLLGALLHDLGKTKEMKTGVYQSVSSVTHRYLGLEMVQPFREDIVSVLGEDMWYNLVSIFLQHHNEFDDKCRTLASRIVFEADYLDSKLTGLVQALEQPSESTAGKRVKFDGNWLQV